MLCALLILSLSAAGVELYAHPRLHAPSPLYAQPPLYALRSELPEDAILVANNRIHVPLGRAVFVDPVDDLVVQTRPGDRCSLTVLDYDPLAQRPGRLSPEKFPCNFGPGDVTYTHYGARSPALDRVRLQLRYDARTETVVIPFVIEVQVDFTPLEVLTKNLPMTVTHLRGTSDAVNSEILDFTFDRESYECQAMSLAGKSALPRYGRLLDGGKPFQTMDCDRLTRADIRYEHTFRGPSPNRDRVPMAVELRDREGNLVKQEHFHLTVQIHQGRENTAPRPSLAAAMMMEVSQFAMTALTPEMLAADDAEADPRELAFNVTLPLSYEEGYIVSTDDQNLPITSFYQRDLRDLKIAYKPPSLDADTERIFQLEFEAVDPEGAASDPFAFMIVVKPLNSLAPAVTRNAGQLLYEGQSRPLVTGRNLEIGDEDELEAVRIAAVGGLRHGILLVRGCRGDTFTAADLAAGAVAYRHDGSDTHSDNIVFRMTDGKHHVEFLFPITVVPTDDEPPVVSVNAGLVLSKRRMTSVSPLALGAADIDSDDSVVQFTVVSPYSAVGALLLRQSDAPADPSTWKFNSEDEVYEKEVREWLQRDITEGKLFYKHVGPRNINTVTDHFVFTVRDDNNPPNESGRATFVIRVLPIDTVPPELHPGTTLLMTVEEFKLTPFSKQILRYTDLDSEDRDLKYTVLRPPTDTDENHPVIFGSLVLTDHTDVNVSEFTQAQVNRRKIAYGPPARELGITLHVVQFWYGVEDAAGNRAEGVFTIHLRPINNKPPQITNAGFAVFEGGVHVVTLAELDAVDADTESQSLTFQLARPPGRGTVRAAFADLPEKATFGLRDLSEGRISYSHSGEGTAGDEFHLDVSDGVHVVGVTVKVHVRPVDDEAPTPSPPDGTVCSRVDVLENDAAQITSDVIRGCHDDARLTFVLRDPPAVGEILVKGLPASGFTQADVMSGAVVYAHTGGEIGPTSRQDSFNLTLADASDHGTAGGKRVRGVHVRVTVLPVDSHAPAVRVGVRFGVLEGGKNAIGPQHLNVDDPDTPAEDILCTIGVQPKTGYVENISPAPGSEKSRSGAAVSAFTVGDIRAGNIFYVQSVHRGVEPAEDRFSFRCSDGINFSEELVFPILIEPTNDEPPEIFLREIAVRAGASAALDAPVANGRDADTPAHGLTFVVSRRPEHGVILKRLPTGSVLATNFTLEDVREASRIVYQHDGSETTADSFELILTDGKLSARKTATVNIIAVDDDSPGMRIDNGLEPEDGGNKRTGQRSSADRCRISLEKDSYVVGEGDVFVEVLLRRRGYLGHTSFVGIATRDGSAKEDRDFRGESRGQVRFDPGQTGASWRFRILADGEYERAETFQILLSEPVMATLEFPAAATVEIPDPRDESSVFFPEAVLSVEEDAGHLLVPVHRGGDVSEELTVLCYTRQGPATGAAPAAVPSHSDFIARPEEAVSVLRFDKGEREKACRVRVIDDWLHEPPESFDVTLASPVGGRLGPRYPSARVTILEDRDDDVALRRAGPERVAHVEVLSENATERTEALAPYPKPDDNMVAEPRAAHATAYVQEADVTFPSRPHVLSLLHYDRPAAAGPQPPAGYPIICVTACNARHPHYEKTGSACVGERIDDALTRYRWLVGAPAGPAGVAAPMRVLDLDTFFTSSKAVTLDSIYFQAGSRVQCAARAVNSNGDEGPELSSPIVTISREEGMCPARKGATVGAQPFSAKMRYTGADDHPHSNLIKVSVTMPHVDGMLPLISTRPLSNLERTLSPDGSRRRDHRCSNLLDYDEPSAASDGRQTAAGGGLRGQAALRFYRGLRPDACLWEFNAFYRMSQLLSDCGGNMAADGQVLNLVQSYMSVRVPLYVSYVFRSPGGAGGWTHFDLRSQLHLTFVYDTAVLWRDGIGSHPQARLHGQLYPSSMRLSRHGRLVVEFRTEARFRGLFVHSRSDGRLRGSGTSTVVSADHPGRTFNLSLVRSEPTFDRPAQQWSFTSDFAARDYSGTYTVRLVPCTACQNAEYSVPPACSPGEAVAFDVAVRLQQVSDPVAVEFSLNTNMFLLSQKSVWLSDDYVRLGQESDVTFSEGDTVYGRVMVDPVQNLGDSFICSIEKVFLCSGADGYVPKYNRTNLEFGCLADSPALLHRFKIIDKDQPETQARHFGGVAFNAVLALDDPSAAQLVSQPGSDGFKLDSGALFQVASGREWYIHTIYTVRSEDDAGRGIEKRRHAITGGDRNGVRRSLPAPLPEAAAGIGSDDTRGTNIIHVALHRFKQPSAPDGAEAGEPMGGERVEGAAAVAVAEALLGVLLLVLTGGILTLASRSGAKCDIGRERGRRDDVWETVKGSLSSEPILVVRMQRSHDGYVV